jgi:3-methyladenine DNA glycosylase AlkD
MIEHLLEPLVCERFRNDERYREGHLRVVNALPGRRVLGLHSPEMKQVARQISNEGCDVFLSNGMCQRCKNGTEVISCFERENHDSLCYEEIVIWGYLINLEQCNLAQRFSLLEYYVPVMDNWAVCDTYCAHAKWMKRAEKNILWAFLQRWFYSGFEFEVRFAVVVSMCYFLDKDWYERVFQRINLLDFAYIKSAYTTVKGKLKVAQEGTVHGEEPYYVRMAVAWLLATALAKFPIETKAFVCASNLPADVIQLYVRKARESYRTRDVKAID